MIESTDRDLARRTRMKRIPGVDLFKIIGVIAVITLHVTSLSFPATRHITEFSNPLLIANQAARFAVPYFFIISGYFWGKKIIAGADILQTSIKFVKRVLIVFLAWSFIYLLPYDIFGDFKYGPVGLLKITFSHVLDVAKHPLRFLLVGTSDHLWFLSALMISAITCACLLFTRRIYILLTFSAVLYIIGLLGGAYAYTPIGIHFAFSTRNGPFEGLAFFASGYFLSTMKPNRSWLWKGCVFLAVGYMLHFLELYLLIARFEVKILPDYLLGTFFVGIGFALIALSNAVLPSAHFLSTYATLTLGVYAIHVIYLDLLVHAKGMFPGGLWYPFIIIAVYILSVSRVFLMSKNQTLRQIVT